MAKGQKRKTREAKKPKAVKKVVATQTLFDASAPAPKKKPAA